MPLPIAAIYAIKKALWKFFLESSLDLQGFGGFSLQKMIFAKDFMMEDIQKNKRQQSGEWGVEDMEVDLDWSELVDIKGT